MKINKIIAVPAAALVLTSVCTSCGKKDNKDPSSKSSVKESSSEVTSATEEKPPDRTPQTSTTILTRKLHSLRSGRSQIRIREANFT